MRPRRIAMAALALLLGAFATVSFANPPTGPPSRVSEVDQTRGGSISGTRLEHEGRRLFEEGCSSCHGFDGAGVPGQGPPLSEAGEAAADFYLRTGRMPLDQVGEQPLRGQPRYGDSESRALVA
jgi:mono/diheme cytochrome c family protein